MSDLIARLRTMSATGWHPIGNEAADEIDRLTRERDEHARWRAELADKLHATESLVSELRAERDAMAKGVSDVAALIAESRGVAGLHLNGDEAPWDDLRTGGQYEEWLLNFDVANAQVEQGRSDG